MIRTHLFETPDEDSAQALAADLALRGHRFVRSHPHEGRWRLESLVDEEAPGPEAEFGQAAHEAAATGALARGHGGHRRGEMIAHRRTALMHREDDADDAASARAIRREVVARFPATVKPPEPTDPLATRAGSYRPLFEVLRTVATADSWWRTTDADAFAGSSETELVFELHDTFMHQGSCYDHTAREVPLIAALAAHDDVRPALRATLVDFLFLAATAGRRFAAADTDRRDSLGLSQDEDAEERSAREAVEASAPALLARWDDESEAVCFALALLAAACPRQGRHLAGEITAWAESEGDSPRSTMLRLAAALAADSPELEAVLAGALAEGFGRAPANPAEPAEGTALGLLEEWAERELSMVLETL